jgi:hypothetical protein
MNSFLHVYRALFVASFHPYHMKVLHKMVVVELVAVVVLHKMAVVELEVVVVLHKMAEVEALLFYLTN